MEQMVRWLFLVLALSSPAAAFAASASTSIRVLYPSFAGSWATAWIAKEAGYFSQEGLDVELIRVGGSTRMVAAMIGGSAPIIQAGAAAAIAASAAGGDVVIIGATGTVSPFRLMARPEIKQAQELKGKKAGITTFGSTSDQVVRIALKKFNLEPNKDVALLSFGAQPEVFAALQSGAVQAGAFDYITKPVTLPKLGITICNCLRLQELTHEVATLSGDGMKPFALSAIVGMVR